MYKLPVRINDAVALPFIVDSGAAEVSIPADVFLVLLRGKTVSKADDLGSSKFTQADGTTVSSERFLLHKMSLGDHVVTDVVANVVPRLLRDAAGGCRQRDRASDQQFHRQRDLFLSGGPSVSLPDVDAAGGDRAEKEGGRASPHMVELPRAPPKPAVSDENASAVICG